MLIFAHIFAGTVFGLIFMQLNGDTRFIPICIAGSILPDFIDKPLGYIFFPQLFDSGTIFFHTLVFVAFVFIVALVLQRYWYTLLGIAFAGTVLLHQILDDMWNMPVTWFYPLFGPFPSIHIANYFGVYFIKETTSVSEWFFFLSTLVLLWLVYIDRYPNSLTTLIRDWMILFLYTVLFLLCIFGIYSLVCAFCGIGNVLIPYSNFENNVALALVTTAECIILIKNPLVANRLNSKK